jgi:inosine-uridine nucleoside N-ribohydrolase
MGIRVIVDTDAGVDDALALILVLRSPELRVETITTVSGNVSVGQATSNVFKILDLLDPESRPMVARGAHQPLKKKPLNAHRVHGADGLGELHRFKNADGNPRYPEAQLPADLPEASSALLETLARYPNEVTVISLGPLTNLASALLADAERFRKAKELVIMGGAIAVPGNITPAAEFNIYADPHSARLVFASGLPIRLIPLDVTEKIRLEASEVKSLSRAAEAPLGQFLADASSRIMQYMEETRGRAELVLHDPLTVGVVVEPSLVGTRPLSVDVETEASITQGMTLADLRPVPEELKQPPNLQVAMEVDERRFKTIFRERLCQRSS